MPWVSPGWLGLASGILGSIALLLPPLLLEYFKSNRSTLREIRTKSPDLERYRATLEDYLTRQIEEADEGDAFWLFVGGLLLMFYFVYQVPGKLELARMNSEIESKLNAFKLHEIEPLRDRLQELENR